MKQITLIAVAVVCSLSVFAQTDTSLKTHYEKYYKAMKAQGDVRGVINAMTHLNVLEPSVERRDTLAYLYLSNGKFREALNTVGIEKNASDSDMNVEVKAFALKNLNQYKLALEQYEVLYKRKPNVYMAYEMADMKIQLDDLSGAAQNIDYGIANVKDDDKQAFYETQQPYEASLKAAFLYLKGLMTYKKDNTANIDAALKLINDALNIDPNFNLARISREALESQKAKSSAQTKN